MISEKIKKEEKKSHGTSNFEVHFEDGSQRHEIDTSWTEMSYEKDVEFMGEKKRVLVSKHPVKKIIVSHGELSTEIVIPKGHEVYQATRSETIFMNGGQRIDRVLGKVVGLVKNNEVVEERYLNGQTGEITGFRK